MTTRTSKQKRAHYLANKDRINAKCREYYSKNRERILAQKKQFRAEHLDTERAADRVYHASHRDERIKKCRERYRIKKEEYGLTSKRWREAHPGYQSAYMRKWKAKRRAENPKLEWWRATVLAAKSRAKKSGLPFDLDSGVPCCDIPDVCPALGVTLDYRPSAKLRGPTRNSPSLDRIIPELGYVQGNVAVISHRANGIKNNANVEELARVLAYARMVTPQRRLE